MERYYGKIELAAIAILVILLSLNYGGREKISERVLAAEHITSELTEDGILVSGNNAYVLDGSGGSNTLADGTKPTAEPTPEAGEPSAEPLPGASEPDDPLAGYDEAVAEAYRAATELTVPEEIAFADVEESLSVRAEPDGESEQIGTLYPNNACTVLSVDGEWAKITSGTLSGYCRVKYLIRGEEAQELAARLVVRTATTNANVNLRSSATTHEDNVLRTVTPGETFPVLTPAVLTDDPDAPLFVEVKDGEQTAYLAIGKVKLSYGWITGSAK